jgi:hypothetical protein
VEANSTGGQGSRRAVAPSGDDHDDDRLVMLIITKSTKLSVVSQSYSQKPKV